MATHSEGSLRRKGLRSLGDGVPNRPGRRDSPQEQQREAAPHPGAEGRGIGNKGVGKVPHITPSRPQLAWTGLVPMCHARAGSIESNSSAGWCLCTMRWSP
jgi:hypothetical protein